MQEDGRNGFMTIMEEKFIPVAARLGTQRHLLAMRDGVVMMMPLLIIGAFSMVVAEFPNQGFQSFMAATFGEDWNAFESVIMHATYGIAALVACFGVASSLVRSYYIDGTPAGVIGMSALMAVIVPSVLTDGDKTVEAWIAGSFDANLLFTALLVAVATGEIYRLFIQRNITIKLPGAVPPLCLRSSPR